MSLRLYSRQSICRFFAFLMMTLVTGGYHAVLAAPPDPVDNALAHSESKRCYEVEDLCGWVELGTHDSIPIGRPLEQNANADEIAETEIAQRTNRESAKPARQQPEQFEIAGQLLAKSMEAWRSMQQWWESNLVTPVEVEVSASDWLQFDFLRVDVPMQTRMDLIASQEPVDVPERVQESRDEKPEQEDALVSSLVVEQLDRFPPDPVSLTIPEQREDPLVGSAPMIVSIEETYMAYDMSERDVKLWSVIPTTTRPFCIRTRGGDFDACSLWEEFDQVVQAEPAVAVESIATEFRCSPYCVLEDWVSRMERWCAEDSPWRSAVQPESVGRHLAGVTHQQSQLARRAALVLAQHWRKGLPEPRPSPAGEALLARANAVASDGVEAAAESSPIVANVAAASSSTDNPRR